MRLVFPSYQGSFVAPLAKALPNIFTNGPVGIDLRLGGRRHDYILLSVGNIMIALRCKKSARQYFPTPKRLVQQLPLKNILDNFTEHLFNSKLCAWMNSKTENDFSYQISTFWYSHVFDTFWKSSLKDSTTEMFTNKSRYSMWLSEANKSPQIFSLDHE